jgi:hypothetical protein
MLYIPSERKRMRQEDALIHHVIVFSLLLSSFPLRVVMMKMRFYHEQQQQQKRKKRTNERSWRWLASVAVRRWDRASEVNPAAARITNRGGIDRY